MTTKKTFLQRLWLQARSIAAGVGTFFSRMRPGHTGSAAKSAGTTETPGIEHDDLDENHAYRRYTDQIEGLDDVMVKLGLHKRISAGHDYMYEMGRRDGALGVWIENLADIARATAQEMFRHVYVLLKGSVAAVQAERDTRNDIMQHDKEAHLRDQAYYDYVKYQYRFFPRTYSWFLFLFYFVIAIALILADIPLAQQLIRSGFNLPGSDLPGESLRELFTGDFWTIIAINWETMVTALGITLCTVYIKIYYDEFIGTPYANKLMTFNRFLEENRLKEAAAADAQEPLHRSVKGEYMYKRRWKTGLAIFTICTIVALAFFRMQTAMEVEKFKFSIAGQFAFITITILFPLIGGICLSHALNNLQNMSGLIRARQRCVRSRRLYLQSVQQFSIIQKKCQDLESANDRLCDEERVLPEYTEYLIAFYRRGYSIGSMQPDKYAKGEDFFSKVMEWRNIAIARKINQNIGKLNGLQ